MTLPISLGLTEKQQNYVCENKFVIKNELLFACLGWIHPVNAIKNSNGEVYPYVFYGFSRGKNREGYTLLCKLLRLAFNLYRYPYFEDRLLVASSRSTHEVYATIQRLNSFLDSETIQDAVNELFEMYHHIQKILSNCLDRPFITLKRVMSRTFHNAYDMDMAKSVIANQILENKFFQISMDCVNSYTSSEAEYDYGTESISIVHDVPMQDILCFFGIVSATIETNEWHVINRSTDGVMDLPVNGIIFNPIDIITQIGINDKLDALSFLHNNYKPAIFNCIDV